jgi:hypothetical protein
MHRIGSAGNAPRNGAGRRPSRLTGNSPGIPQKDGSILQARAMRRQRISMAHLLPGRSAEYVPLLRRLMGAEQSPA